MNEGEWTAQDVREMIENGSYITIENGWQAIADARNAALDQEREKLRIALADNAPLLSECDQLREQLAVERDKCEVWLKRLKFCSTDNDELREQLATLVDALKRCVSRLTPCHEEGAVYKQAIEALKEIQKINTADLHIGPFDTSEIKPTAGEWTVEYVRDLKETRGYITSEEGWQAIADAHNATLGALRAVSSSELEAERDKRSYSRLHVDLAEAKAQLAAEREKVKDLEQVWNALEDNKTLVDALKQLREQLAVERERCEEPRCDFVSHLQLREQLPTAVEALQEIQKINIKENDAHEAADRMGKIADAALAKVSK